MGFLTKRDIAAACGALLFAPAAVWGGAPEYQVKAAILYKFAVFVEWPAGAFASAASPFVACVVGKDPFGPWLQQEMGDARVGTHPVEIRRAEGGGAEGCHAVFISASEESRLEKVVPPLAKGAALIISDTKDAARFCRAGGMICLVMEGGKVRFLLNSKAIDQAGLKVDSRLKRVALSAECGKEK